MSKQGKLPAGVTLDDLKAATLVTPAPNGAAAPGAPQAGQGAAPSPTPAPAPTGTQAGQGINLFLHPADDEGHARTLLEMLPDRFWFTETLGWLTWCGTHWQREGAEAELHQAIVTMLRARRVAAVQATPAVEALVKSCVASRARILGVAFCVQMHRHADIASFDADPDLLNVANGVLHLPSGQLMPHDSTQRFTYCLPTPYDPTADYSHWTRFLEDVVGGGQPVIDYLQAFAGYSLSGHTSEENLLYLHGPSRAGKGSFAETLTTMLGRPLSAAATFATFVRRRDAGDQGFDLAPLRPARLVVASESNERDKLNSAMIKGLTGGDTITCSHKHQDSFEYRPIFKLIMLSNHPVNGDADDAALWGRLRIVHFPKSFLGSEDKHLKDRLKAPDSLRGVLRWAVEGAMAWYASPAGLVTPDAVKLAVQAHHDAVDDVAQWLAECAVAKPGNWETVEKLYTSYRNWAVVDHGLTPRPSNKLTTALLRRGFTASRRTLNNKQARCVEGIQLI